MEYIALIPFVGPLLAVLIPFIFVLGVVVFIHELGHYLVGRWCGIHAEAFSVGFGKEIWARVDSRGTRWRIAILPLGGYVKFLGDGDAASANADRSAIEAMSEEDRKRTLNGADLWRRMATVAAGPIFNFILSIVIFGFIAYAVGVGKDTPVIGELDPAASEYGVTLQLGDEVLAVDGQPVSNFGDIYDAFLERSQPLWNVEVMRDGQRSQIETASLMPPAISAVHLDTPAEAAGLQAGDRLLEINGQPAYSFEDLRDAVMSAPGTPVQLLVMGEDGGERTVDVKPEFMQMPTEDGGVEERPLIGVSALYLAYPEVETPGLLQMLDIGVARTFGIVTQSLSAVSGMISGSLDAKNLGGPVKIATMSGQAAEAGWINILSFIAMISASIGLLNLFPIPVLDGGHLVFYMLEAIRGRPLNARAQEIATGVGLALVLTLMIFVTWNDIS